MKNNITLIEIFQSFISEEEVLAVYKEFNYEETSRKFKGTDLYEFFIIAAINEYKSYRYGADLMGRDGLNPVNYSTISKKANCMNYKIAKRIFELLISKCNRPLKRILKLDKDIIAIDSTTISVGKGRLKWAKYKSHKAGIKLHVAFNVNSNQPQQVKETNANKHDGPVGEEIIDIENIIVEDRAYANYERFDTFNTKGQSFVIRIKNNAKFLNRKSLKYLKNEDSKIAKDFTCYLGNEYIRTENRFRVVTFKDYKGKTIQVCTNIKNIDPDRIAEIYKARWNVECFFRFIKQNLNVKTLFGTTENAVYNQLFIALIAYVLLKFLHNKTIENPRFNKLSFARFFRKFLNLEIEDALLVFISLILKKIHLQKDSPFL
ncbi:MAG: IS4 family transposase [Sarcina sp.]